MTDKPISGDATSEIKEAGARLTQAVSSAATHIVGAIAGIPAATWAGSIVAAEVGDNHGESVTGAIAAASATGFGVVILSSLLFSFVVVPLLTFLVRACLDKR